MNNGFYTLQIGNDITKDMRFDTLIATLNQLMDKWYYLKFHLTFGENITPSVQERLLAMVNAHNINVDQDIDR